MEEEAIRNAQEKKVFEEIIETEIVDKNEQIVAIGDMCAEGHCEDENNCPRCEKGLACWVDDDVMHAGTKMGVCGKSVV